MGNQESKTMKDKAEGKTKAKVKKNEESVNLEKKRSQKTAKHQTKKEERKEQRDVNKRQRKSKGNGDNKNETGEIKYVIRRSYIRSEDDAQKDLSNNQSANNENNVQNQDADNEREVKYIIRRSYIRNDDDDDSGTTEGEQRVHDNVSDREEKHRDEDYLKTDNHSKDDPMTDANINCETKSDMNGNILHVPEPEPKHHEADEKVHHINNNAIQSKETNMATVDLERPRVNDSVDDPNKDNIPVDQSTSSEHNTTTSDTPNTTIDTSFDSKMDTMDDLSDESDESVGSDDSVETFEMMTIRRIDLNPVVVYDNLNESHVSMSLPDMTNDDTLTTFQSQSRPDDRIRYYTLPASGSRNRNTSYDNIRYHSSLETVLEDNGDNGQQDLEDRQMMEGKGNRFEENAELSDYYDNVSLDSLTRSPRLSSPSGSIDIFNETDDNKIQKELKHKHRQLWLYEYDYEDLSRRRIPRTQRPRTWAYYKSTNSLDGYLNRYRPSRYHHRGCMSLSHDVLDRGYNHGGYVNRHGVFVSYDRSPSGVLYGTNNDPGNISDSSLSTLENEGYFVTPSRYIQTAHRFEETGMDGHHHGHTHIHDSQMRECDSHDPLYSTIEETKQMPIENLYQEVSGKGGEDKNNNIRERSAAENVVPREQDDLTDARNSVPDENVKPGHESEVDVCCGWGSNNKVIAINSTRKVRN